MKIGIIVCSNSGADYFTFDHPVEIIYSTLHINGKLFQDFIDITAEQFYDLIADDDSLDIKTSMPSVGSIIEKYEKLRDMGYNNILAITMSTKLSAISHACKLAAEMTEGVNVRIINSKSVSYGELYLVFEAIKLIKAGYDLEEVATKVEAIIPKINILIYVDTLKFLVKNGRLSVASGAIGTLLKIKPILRLEVEDGTVVPFERIRTSRKALQRIIEIYLEETKDRDFLTFIGYTNNKELAEEVKSRILEIRPNTKIEFVYLTPIVGTHAGPGTLGLGYIFLD